MLWAVSRAPLPRLQAYQRRMGWSFPWASSYGSDFNFDYSVGFPRSSSAGKGSKSITGARLRCCERGAAERIRRHVRVDTPAYLRERPGVSAFALEDGMVHHTYSSYGRGVDGLWGMYQWLDRAPKGRNENAPWWRRHDEYTTP